MQHEQPTPECEAAPALQHAIAIARLIIKVRRRQILAYACADFVLQSGLRRKQQLHSRTLRALAKIDIFIIQKK